MSDQQLGIKSILDFILKALMQKDPSIDVLDDMHIMDTHTGVEYHLYDTHSKITHGDDEIMTSFDMTPEEQKVLWDIKQIITDPVTTANKKENHHELLRGRRKEFSHLYAEPQPLVDDSLQPEENTVPYTR